ncbi:MAG TPA: hypothetical protein VGQ41_06075 [Pyrinomonadaceae bacterium]|jgi:hypothetical protein|nr:hypothetical protein [Pyrinomonadaceae bacterium]
MHKQLAKVLKQHFKSSLIESKGAEDTPSFAAEVWARIPEDLITQELKVAGHTTLVLSGPEAERYEHNLSLLRSEPEVEYATDKELKDQLWRLECEVFVNKREFKKDLSKLNHRVEDFIASLIKPLADHEVLIPVEYLSVGSQEIVLGDCKLRTFSEDQLLAWGFGQHEMWRDLLHMYVDKTVIVVKEIGNSPQLIIERARRKAEHALHALRIGFSKRRFTHERQLKFRLSPHNVVRECAPSRIKRGVHKLQGSWNLDYSEQHDTEYVGYADLVLTQSAGLGEDFKARVRRTVHWLGIAVEHEDYDQRVSLLCTAMESLLCAKEEIRKGERIAYRMVLIQSLVGDSFVHPAEILWIYKLRSSVVHGSRIDVAGESEYERMLDATRGTLKSYINLIAKNDLKNFAELIKHIESSTEAEQLLQWLDSHAEDENIQELKEALKGRIRVAATTP